jgi:hypothetical protein
MERVMEDLEPYLDEIVEPTVNDFRKNPSSVRIGFLTCVAIDHSVDYLAFPRDHSLWDGKEHRSLRAKLRAQFKEENSQFRMISEAANAFKHVKTTSERGLEAAQVYERPPAIEPVRKSSQFPANRDSLGLWAAVFAGS